MKAREKRGQRGNESEGEMRTKKKDSEGEIELKNTTFLY